MIKDDYMSSLRSVEDASGTALQVGDQVVLINAPEELLRDLPSEDKVVIQAQVGKSVEVQGFDEHGYAELEFTDLYGTMHFIWVKGSALKKKSVRKTHGVAV